MTFNKATKNLATLTILLILCIFISACGSSGGGGDDTRIEGTLGTPVSGRALAPGALGISGVTISALGDSSTTDENGSFNLNADGNIFQGGPVAFTLSGNGVAAEVTFSNVAGGPGNTAFVDLTLEPNGSISGISSDSEGNVLSRVTGGAQLGCTENQSFQDGGGGNLWKPVSESTGTVVILMPGEFRNAGFDIFNANGNQAATVIRQSCCEHNGGRDHRYLNRSASSLAGESLPLTVRYSFPSGRVVCLEVATPTARLD